VTAYRSLLRDALVALLLLVPTARAQIGLGGELDLSVEAVGVGDRARAGEWTGVRLRVTNPGETRELVLRIETRDADGDRPQYERVVTANTNVPQSVWVYVRVPFPTQEMSTLYRVSAYEAVESSESHSGFRAGRLVAQTPLVFTQGQLFQSIGSPSVIGVVGTREVGLRRYTIVEPGEAYPPTMHERTELVQLRPDELPDRWLGLAVLDTIVWTGGQPQSVRPESARALREWIERGGHFIVVLPSTGTEWYTRLNNELYELMPAASPRRLEDVDLGAFRPLLVGLGTEDKVQLPSRAVVHVFDPAPGREPGEAVRVLNDPEGRCVVVRRDLGAGAVTVIGIDLLNSYLTAQQLPRADVFWNRVLGRRGMTPTPPELDDLREGDMSRRAYRGSTWMDDGFAGEIAERGQSAKGVLLGFVLFGVYWAVAGPVGFAVLKRTKKTHHAWMMFLASIGVFTAVAWGGAMLIRPKRVSANHLTMITHVYGQDVQRARSWLSLMVPSYGRATLSVGEADPEGGAGVRRRFHQAVAPWESRQIGGFGRAFPDARGYPIDSAQPDSVSFPARQTVKQFRVDWAGLTPWGGMPRPVGTSPEPKLEWAPREGLETHRVVGTLVHELPGPLEDVVVIVNRQQTTLGGAGSNVLMADAVAFAPPGPWAPEVPLDLWMVTNQGSRDRQERRQLRLSELLRSLTPMTGVGGAVVHRGIEQSLQALALYPLLEPAPVREGVNQQVAAVVRRAETHGIDVGRWLTRPCVIVLGQVRETSGTAPPIPLYVNGRAVEARGRTLVMWVYPLPDDPPGYHRSE